MWKHSLCCNRARYLSVHVYVCWMFICVCVTVSVFVLGRCWRRTLCCARKECCLSSLSMTVTSCSIVWHSLRCKSTPWPQQPVLPHTFELYSKCLYSQPNNRLDCNKQDQFVYTCISCVIPLQGTSSVK